MSTTISTSQTVQPPTHNRNLAAPSVQPPMSNKPLRQVANLDELFSNRQFRDRIAEGLPKHMSPDRMLRVMSLGCRKTPLIAQADMGSVIGAFLLCSQTGLEPNGPLNQLHLIPFKRTKWNPQTRQREDAGVDLQVIFGYPGLLELHYRSPLVKSITAEVVYAGDEFDFSLGTENYLRHRPKGGGARGARVIAAYAVAQLVDGHAFKVLPVEEVEAIRDASQAYRMALAMKEDADSKGYRVPAAFREAPWVKFFGPMAAKTAFRALSKWLPRSVEMAAAVAIDEAQERRRNIDWGAVMDAEEYTDETGHRRRDYLSAGAAAADGEDPEEGEPGQNGGQNGGQQQGGQGEAQGQPQGATGGQAQRQDPAPQATPRATRVRRQEAPREEPAAQATASEERQEAAVGGVFGGDPEDPGPVEGDPGPVDPGAATDAGGQAAARPSEISKPRATRGRAAGLPPFSAEVLDQYGDPVDGVGHEQRLDWANAYAAVWEGCESAAMTEALAEFNADALADAGQDRKAAAMIEGLSVPTARMKREAAEAAKVVEKQAAADPSPAEQPPAKDADKEWADALCADAEKASLSDVNAMIAHKGIRERMAGFVTKRPDLYAMVEKAFKTRLDRKS